MRIPQRKAYAYPSPIRSQPSQCRKVPRSNQSDRSNALQNERPGPRPHRACRRAPFGRHGRLQSILQRNRRQFRRANAGRAPVRSNGRRQSVAHQSYKVNRRRHAGNGTLRSRRRFRLSQRRNPFCDDRRPSLPRRLEILRQPQHLRTTPDWPPLWGPQRCTGR
jgi:hypothetical protein